MCYVRLDIFIPKSSFEIIYFACLCVIPQVSQPSQQCAVYHLNIFFPNIWEGSYNSLLSARCHILTSYLFDALIVCLSPIEITSIHLPAEIVKTIHTCSIK